MRGKPFDESEYIGKIYGDLTVIRFTRNVYYDPSRFSRMCLVRCKCGNEKEVRITNLQIGKSHYCDSCAKKSISEKNFKHGCPVEYITWRLMLDRCYNTKTKAYVSYGAKGVIVCNRWHNFYNFLNDMRCKPTKNHTIERLNPEGNYEPGNCIWLERSKQHENKRLTNRLTMCLLARQTGYSRERIRQLLYFGTKILSSYVQEIYYGHPIFKQETINFLKQKRLQRI